ncbi:MAG: UDP-2,3-diacylglucosamine diphosphatase [Lentisphaerota bacterium]
MKTNPKTSEPPENPPKDVAREAPAFRHYRTIWISDAHLGWSASEAESLLDFLKHHEADYWFLVGDMVDGWMLKRNWYWPQAHNDVVQKLLRKVRKGAQVVYIPGNHDEFARRFAPIQLGGISVMLESFHQTADGRKLWILHGDEFDSVVQYAPWMAILGNNGYDLMIHLGRALNRLRRLLGLREWSLSAHIKQRVKNIVKFVTDYEQALAREARKRGANGVVCGHIHKAEIRPFDGVMYYNTGDWVESCTALIEKHDGGMEIISWKKSLSNPAKL